MGKHARLGPSNHRWPKCAGSVREEANYEDVPSAAAIDGTGTHELLEMCINNGVDAIVYDGQIIAHNHPDNLGGWLVDKDRCDRVQVCLEYIYSKVQELKSAGYTVKVHAESKSNPGEFYGRNDWWGTVDITISAYDQGRILAYLEIVDYKDGRGWVPVDDNSQLIAYAAGKLHGNRVDVPTVMTIVQPKTSPARRSQKSTSTEVRKAADELAVAAAKTDDPNAPLVPDSKGGKGYCRWCKHKPNCTAESNRGIEVFKSMSKDIIATDGQSLFELVESSVADVESLTAEQLVELADTEAAITGVYTKLKEEIQKRIDDGITVPGYAMLPGRATKAWNEDEEKMVKVFRARKLKQDDYYPKKLISPAQALKLDSLTKEQKEKLKKEYVTDVAGKNKLTRVVENKAATVQDFFTSTPAELPSLFDEKKPLSFF